MFRKNAFLGGIILFFISGCAQFQETAKTVWGSSTRVLEEARAEGLQKSLNCSFDECYEEVLKLGRHENSKILAYKDTLDSEDTQETEKTESQKQEEAAKAAAAGFYDIFIQDRIKRHIVVMGIPGNVDTTEVGIFFTRLKPKVTKIEISSLSSTAKRKVAEAVFSALGKIYAESK